jgi:hypothetical protein
MTFHCEFQVKIIWTSHSHRRRKCFTELKINFVTYFFVGKSILNRRSSLQFYAKWPLFNYTYFNTSQDDASPDCTDSSDEKWYWHLQEQFIFSQLCSIIYYWQENNQVLTRNFGFRSLSTDCRTKKGPCAKFQLIRPHFKFSGPIQILEKWSKTVFFQINVNIVQILRSTTVTKAKKLIIFLA